MGKAEFRELMNAFPTGVAIVATVDGEGRPFGMTCTSLTSVSLAPPTLLVCLNKLGATLAAIQDRGRFSVNFLHSRGRAAAEVFSSPGPDRFEQVRWAPVQPSGLPLLVDDAFAVAVCDIRNTTAVGDHQIVLGEVQEIEHHDDDPLLYGFRRFTSWLRADSMNRECGNETVPTLTNFYPSSVPSGPTNPRPKDRS